MFRILLKTLGGVTATLVIMGLLALGAARVLLPKIDYLRPQAQAWLSARMGQTVEIESLAAVWSGWTPLFSARKVRVLDQQGNPRAQFEGADFSLDPMESLQTLKVELGDLTVTGALLRLEHQADGAIALAGVGGGGSDRAALREVAAWLLSQPRLELRSTTIVWQELESPAPSITISEVQLMLRNDAHHHRVEGAVTFPSAAGGMFEFSLDASGELNSSTWSGELSARGDQIEPSTVPALAALVGDSIAQGSISFNLTGRLQDGELETLNGSFNLSPIRIAGPTNTIELPHGTGRISADRTKQGWRVDLRPLELRSSRGPWPATQAMFNIAGTPLSQDFSLDGELGFVRLADLAPVFAEHLIGQGETRALVRELEPAGELRQVKFAFDRNDGLSIEGAFHNLGVQPAGFLPGLYPLAGKFDFGADGGALEIDAHAFRVDIPSGPAEPVFVDRASGRIEWHRDANGWRVQTEDLTLANADLHATLAGQATSTDSDPSPQLDLTLTLSDGTLDHLSRYLPSEGMSPKLAAFFARAFQQGRLSAGEVRVSGRAAKFPFDDGEGEFTLRGQVEIGRFDYEPPWPALTDLQADVEVSGRDLKVTVARGGVLDARLIKATATVAGMGRDAPVLKFRGSAKGRNATGLKFLRESPLAKKFGKLMSDFDSSGTLVLDLNMDIPLSPEPNRINGTVRLTDSVVRAKPLDLEIDKLHGALHFTERSLSSDGIEGRYLGQPVSLDISRSEGEDNATQVRLAGVATSAFVSQWFASAASADDGTVAAITPRIEGETPWRATLTMPDKKNVDANPATLSIASELRGLAVDLPQPLGKAREEDKTLVVDLPVTREGDQTVAIRYGPEVRAIAVLDRGANRLRRGTLQFGGQNPKLPAANGLLIQGSLEELSLDRWLELFDVMSTGSASPPATAAAAPRVAIDARRLQLMDRWFANVRLDVGTDADGRWNAEFLGDEIRGNARLPRPGTSDSLDIDLQRLALMPSGESPVDPAAAAAHDPRALPALQVSCADLSYDGRPLGTLDIATTPHPGGLWIDRADLRGDSFQLSATGGWSFSGEQHHSDVRFELTSDDFGKLLRSLGNSSDIAEGKKTEISASADWVGPPQAFSLETMKGALRFKTGAGRLRDVSHGATGRLVGLLNLQSLPRRLKLDFSDLFRKGFSYDGIEGNFTIEAGSAYTDDLVIASPAARIKTVGRIGLVAEDYDQSVTVMPRLGVTLPIAGGVVAGPAGAGVGAAIWLADKLFDTQIVDRIAAYTYTVKGHWNDPTIKRTGEPKKKKPAENGPR